MISDEKNNRIYPITKKTWIHYYLHLNWEQTARKLWTLKWDTFEIKRDREKHLFIKNNSYWFNDWLLRKILTPDTVVIIKEAKRRLKLKTTVQEILEKGTYLYFATMWFERQIFLPLSSFDNIL